MASLGASLRRFFVRLWNPPWFQSLACVVESVHLIRALCVAAELGIADLVQERPRDVSELALATDTDPAMLSRWLRTLAAFGFFSEDRRGRFRMTRRARVLLSDRAGSLRSWLTLMGREELWAGYAQTLQSVKSGVPAFKLAHGVDFYEYMATHPDMATTFAKALDEWTQWQCREIVSAFDFSRFATVVDVGGGMGSLLQHVLERHPAVHGILLDRPETIRLAAPRFEAAGLTGRCELVGGSFIESVPAGGDLYLVKHVLRDWDDERATMILRNCYQAMQPGATLLIVGAVVDPRNGADRIVKLVDLELGSLLRGRLRTREELNQLLSTAGFDLVREHGTAVPDSQIVEVRKPRDAMVHEGASAMARPHTARQRDVAPSPLANNGRQTAPLNG